MGPPWHAGGLYEHSVSGTHPLPTSAITLASHLQLLRWQVRWRALVAAVSAAVVIAYQRAGWFAGEPDHVALLLGLYLVLVSGAAAVKARGDRPGLVAAHVTILADVAALIALAAIASRPGHHDWVLLVGFFIVHLAEYSFGRPAAILAITGTVVGYLGLMAARAQSAPAEWGEAVFAVAAFLGVTATFLAQYASRRRRLRKIIALFERAEQGDFSGSYDLDADRRPDAVSVVGAAYNQVRRRLERLVLTDPLTGCLNRRGFAQAMDRELARAARSGGTLALLALDIDRFKDINDTHGHPAGDDVLRQLGALLHALVRAGDVVARAGGDEFLVLCPQSTAEGAMQLALRICEKVEAHDFDGGGTRVPASVSIGIATADLPSAEDVAVWLQRHADRALYEAKRGGRNQARLWAGTAETPARLVPRG